MKKNFEKLGDILIVDTTYNINYYSTPLVVLSGVDNKYQNVLFGFAFINNEQTTTYSWVLNEFNSIVKDKPVLIMSDQDLALGAAIKQVYPGIKHRLCAWHIVRNLRRKFGFLKRSLRI